MIDWDNVINNLRGGVEIVPEPANWNLSTHGYTEIYNQWKAANFNMASIQWINYYPGKHFDKDIETAVATQLKIKPMRSWISQINPGYCAPWHWDVDDNEAKYLEHGELVRYTVFIDTPRAGQFFQVGDKYFVNQPQFTCVKWDNYKEWHAGSNAGLTPNYMFHIIGTC